jgi:hypothetical protein
MSAAEQFRKEFVALTQEEEQIKERKRRFLDTQKHEILSLIRAYCEAVEAKEADVLLEWFPALGMKAQMAQATLAEKNNGVPVKGAGIRAYRVPGGHLLLWKWWH